LMNFLRIVVMIEYGLQAGLALVGAGMVTWAMADAARRPAGIFDAHTNQTKPTWSLILGGAMNLGLGSAWLTMVWAGRMGLFGLAAIVAAGVYLAGPKRQFELWA